MPRRRERARRPEREHRLVWRLRHDDGPCGNDEIMIQGTSREHFGLDQTREQMDNGSGCNVILQRKVVVNKGSCYLHVEIGSKMGVSLEEGVVKVDDDGMAVSLENWDGGLDCINGSWAYIHDGVEEVMGGHGCSDVDSVLRKGSG